MFNQVARLGSFTKAADAAGLSQSAVTRQIQNMENLLGVPLLERTTRSVRVTPAGEFLFRESQRMVGDVASTLKRLREDFGGQMPEIRVGISRQIAHAHLPGLFHRQSTADGRSLIKIRRGAEEELPALVESNDLDLAIMDAPSRMPRSLIAIHRFEDAFTFITGANDADHENGNVRLDRFRNWASAQRWILPPADTMLGHRLRVWFADTRIEVEPFMEIDDLDLIVHTVAMGHGVAAVPIRCISTFRRKHTIRRLNLKTRFSRDVVVLTRKHRTMPAHLEEFLGGLLF